MGDDVEAMRKRINDISDQSEGTIIIAHGDEGRTNCVAFYRTNLTSSVADAVAQDIRRKIPGSGRRLGSSSITVSSSAYTAGAGMPEVTAGAGMPEVEDDQIHSGSDSDSPSPGSDSDSPSPGSDSDSPSPG